MKVLTLNLEINKTNEIMFMVNRMKEEYRCHTSPYISRKGEANSQELSEPCPANSSPNSCVAGSSDQS